MAKLLIIDDDETMVWALSQFFRGEGHDVVTAGDGPEGIRIFKEQLPDVVLLDLSMPEVHGLVVLDKIKEVDHDARVIIVTGYASSEAKDTCLQRGAFAFYDKATDIDALKEDVRRAVSSRSPKVN